MPILGSNRTKLSQIDFSGGQNSGDDSYVIRDNQAELIENSIITSRGRVEQRGGIQRLGDNPSTLISRWTFDAASSIDDTGDNDGTASNITYVSGKFGKCASFNGTSSSIMVSADSTINCTSTGAFMIQAWVYVDSDGEGSVGRIIDKFSGSDTGYRLWVHSESSGTVKLSFEVGYDSTNSIVVTSTTMTTGAWHRINAVHNSDKSSDIYIDGAIATYSTDTSGDATISDDSAVNLYIGNDSASQYTFDGEIDDVRFYDGSFAADDVEMDSIKGLHHFNVLGTIDTLVRVKDTAVQRLSSDFTTWTNITGATSQTADTTTNFVQANNRLFVLNGTDNVLSIDGSLSVTNEGNTNTDPPRGTVGEWTTNNRLFIAGLLTAAGKDYVYFSDALDPQAFSRNTNNFIVRSGFGSKITQLKMFKEFELIIYKDDSIFVLNMDGATPLTDWNLKPLSTSIGCPAGRTVQDIGNDHIFLANDGVRLLSRTTFDKLRVGVISEPVQDVINSINQDAIQNSVGWFENGLYILGVPVGTSTNPNKFLIWDSIAANRNGDPNTAWTTIPTDTWNFSCMSSFGFGDNKKTIVAGDGRSLSLCYKVLSGNTDDGEAIIQTIIGKDQDFGDSFLKKIFDPTYVIADCLNDESISGTYQVSLSVDRNTFVQFATLTSSGLLVTPFQTPASTVLGSEFEQTTERTKFIGRGNSVRLKVVNQTYNSKPAFQSYTIHARPYGGRIE